LSSPSRWGTAARQTFAPVPSAVLQRKCACGGSPGPSGECEECRKKQLQRKTQNSELGTRNVSTVPSIVHEVLRLPGQPLDPATRTFMEPRFGHDFSRVRVHADSQAAESARAMHSLAYTVGQHVVFGAGQYAFGTINGQRLLAHELTHVTQQSPEAGWQSKLEIGAKDDQFERAAEDTAQAVVNSSSKSPISRCTFLQRLPQGIVQRAAIHTGNILDEGSCEHLACNSKWACKDKENGITCPSGTRNESKTEKFRPLFTCDVKCENGETCSDSDTWMALPKSRFGSKKCGQDLVICANGQFTHGQVRDKSEREAWEVSHGIQDNLGISPYAKFTGAIYGDETDPDFQKDKRCRK